MPGSEGGRRSSEDEQEQDKASQQMALSGSSGCDEGTPASSLELDLPPVRDALGEGGRAGKSGKAKGERKRPSSNSPSRRAMGEEEGSGRLVKGERLRTLLKKKKKERKRETANVRTHLQENSQGRDP